MRALPSNWRSFLCENSNEDGLFLYLAKCIEEMEVPESKVVLTPCRKSGYLVLDVDVSQNSSCTHEGADYRMVIHAKHAFYAGFPNVLLGASDTDVVVLAVVLAKSLTACKVWIKFISGSNF